MNRQKWILALVVLLLIGGTAGLLARLKNNQKLGLPGVKTVPLAGSKNLEVLLPERVLDYSSQVVTQQAIVLNVLPKDTSFGQRIYTAADGFGIQMNVVLMGSDRTSMHKPQFCLEGAGWKIDSGPVGRELIHIARPVEYDFYQVRGVPGDAGGKTQLPLRSVRRYCRKGSGGDRGHRKPRRARTARPEFCCRTRPSPRDYGGVHLFGRSRAFGSFFSAAVSRMTRAVIGRT